MEFYRSMVSVQQENGRIICYCLALAMADLGLSLSLSNFPAEDVYLVNGVSTVVKTQLFWNQSDARIQQLLATPTRGVSPIAESSPSTSPAATPAPAPSHDSPQEPQPTPEHPDR